MYLLSVNVVVNQMQTTVGSLYDRWPFSHASPCIACRFGQKGVIGSQSIISPIDLFFLHQITSLNIKSLPKIHRVPLQVSGVEIYSGKSLKYKRLFFQDHLLASPAGICFSGNIIYIAGYVQCL